SYCEHVTSAFLFFFSSRRRHTRSKRDWSSDVSSSDLGKTLTETMPVYLNALAGKGVHVVTVNDYLATRDSKEMGEVYRFLGLTVGLNLNSMNPSEKREAYNSDITYSTNNELGFDYLRDNMVVYKHQMVQRPL